MPHADETRSSNARRETADAAEAASAAGLWIARRDRRLTPEEAAEFAAWQAADPRHAAELARLEGTWRQLDTMETDPALRALANGVVGRARARQARRRRRNTFLALAAAAAIVLGLQLDWLGREADTPASRLPKENYRVIASTLQRKLLPDGSIAELNGDSRIELDYTESARRVRLVSGEAHFVVMKNAARPFYVTAGPVTVRAVGTAFNVRLASENVEVLVTEGKVKLQHAPVSVDAAATATPEVENAEPALVEGEKAVIPRTLAPVFREVTVDRVGRAEIDHELGWQSTRLVFNNTPLDEVIDGFNRFNQHRLTLGDPKLKERTLTGEFRADNREGFVRLLRASVDVKAEERTPFETVLLPSK